MSLLPVYRLSLPQTETPGASHKLFGFALTELAGGFTVTSGTGAWRSPMTWPTMGRHVTWLNWRCTIFRARKRFILRA